MEDYKNDEWKVEYNKVAGKEPGKGGAYLWMEEMAMLAFISFVLMVVTYLD